jgi:predicted acetyltransferase
MPTSFDDGLPSAGLSFSSPLAKGEPLSGVSPAAMRSTPPLANSQGCVRELGAGARIVMGNAGDHSSVLQLLVQARQAALAEDFQSRLDAPGYQASDRLIVRRGKETLGHVHVTSHIAWFEGQRVPLVRLEDFEMLPEYRGTDYEAELLTTAVEIAAGEGAVLALTMTERGEWFGRHGWSAVRGQGHTRAGAAAVLAHLDAQEQVRGPRRSSVQVRTWRHFELDQVRRAYDETACGLWGALHRSEESWQWLVSRKAQDQVLVAVQRVKAPAADGSERSIHAEKPQNGEQHAEQIVGYAILRGSCLVELVTVKHFRSARLKLLARACHEAMDRDHRWISLYTPASDSLHELLVMSSGAWIDERNAPGPRLMVRLLAPEKWVERGFPLWRQRAREAELPRPVDMTIQAGESTYRFTLTRRSSRLEQDAVGRPDATCDRPVFESLLLGNLALGAAIKSGALQLARPEMAGVLEAIFSPRIFWQSPLESMRA